MLHLHTQTKGIYVHICIMKFLKLANNNNLEKNVS